MTFVHPTELKKRYPFLAKKSLGQHFLVHRPILETIAQRILRHHPHTVLEIGPGPGSLSQLLAPQVNRLVLIEKDSQFKTLLDEIVSPLGSVEIQIQDFLKTDLSAILDSKDQPAIAAGNLPYNVSVAILQKLLTFRNLFTHFYLMFQKEVAKRLTAKPSTKDYGSLTLYAQMLADIKLILPIPPSAFEPRPKVESAVVEIIPLPQPRYPEVDLQLFEKITHAAFNPRRKTLANSLVAGMARDKKQIEETLESIGINPQRRGETLSLKEFAELSLAFNN
jgi:16S rRNA (adenine1518-N6/adenine1519-N6)-dimethyltransferase